jgi:hypothetical protein
MLRNNKHRVGEASQARRACDVTGRRSEPHACGASELKRTRSTQIMSAWHAARQWTTGQPARITHAREYAQFLTLFFNRGFLSLIYVDPHKE